MAKRSTIILYYEQVNANVERFTYLVIEDDFVKRYIYTQVC